MYKLLFAACFVSVIGGQISLKKLKHEQFSAKTNPFSSPDKNSFVKSLDKSELAWDQMLEDATKQVRTCN
ncbi:unnamed protein product [Anisakis simplex]|uniref:Secreted protein n=1 Tax=Anisakis simplex TaxID=6269 RepID=A0A0M3KD57_ANISI|nr:unnamed protein product [Anisakis simplex]